MWAITLINEQNNTSINEKLTEVYELCDQQTITNTYRVEFYFE